jgi:hypothetical protein
VQHYLLKINKKKYIITAEDFNVRVINNPIDREIGHKRRRHSKLEREGFNNFFASNDMRITNTFCEHHNIHKKVWSQREAQTITN